MYDPNDPIPYLTAAKERVQEARELIDKEKPRNPAEVRQAADQLYAELFHLLVDLRTQEADQFFAKTATTMALASREPKVTTSDLEALRRLFDK